MAQEFIEGYITHLRSKSAADRTMNDRRSILTRADQELPYGLKGACEDELRAWLWRDGWSIGTRETYYGALNGFYTWAAKTGRCDFSPMDEIPRPVPPKRLPRPCTNEQLADALAHARNPYRLWALLAAYAGLRCIDISRLHREHITEQEIRVVRSKGGKTRSIPTHPLIWATVKDLPPGPITEHDAKHISIYSALHFGRHLKMRGIALHRFRHWFGTTVQRLNKDILVTQQLLGHEDPASTAGYALVADEQKTAAVGLLPNLAI